MIGQGDRSASGVQAARNVRQMAVEGISVDIIKHTFPEHVRESVQIMELEVNLADSHSY